MNKLKIAVIGTGLVGSFHAETFYRNPNSELVAVCDLDKEKANSIANKFNCKAYENFEQLITTETLDLYAYQQGIGLRGEISYAAAMSVEMVIITIIIFTIIWKNVGKES